MITTLDRVIAGIEHRIPVRITERSGHAKGMTGIAMGYNAIYHTVKVGFLDDAGQYNGDSTIVSASAVEPIDPAGYSLHIGDDSLTIWCPTCDDYLFENDGDQYNQNFESPLSLNAVNRAVQLHADRHHGKPQDAHQQPATTPPTPAPTDPAKTPHTPAQGAAPADRDTNVNCTHGERLQRDYCAACETAEQTPHRYNGVQVRDRHTGRAISRCVDCGLPQGYTAHTWETP